MECTGETSRPLKTTWDRESSDEGEVRGPRLPETRCSLRDCGVEPPVQCARLCSNWCGSADGCNYHESVILDCARLDVLTGTSEAKRAGTADKALRGLRSGGVLVGPGDAKLPPLQDLEHPEHTHNDHVSRLNEQG